MLVASSRNLYRRLLPLLGALGQSPSGFIPPLVRTLSGFALRAFFIRRSSRGSVTAVFLLFCVRGCFNDRPPAVFCPVEGFFPPSGGRVEHLCLTGGLFARRGLSLSPERRAPRWGVSLFPREGPLYYRAGNFGYAFQRAAVNPLLASNGSAAFYPGGPLR